MGIGAKDVKNFMRKVLEFSMNTSNGFVRNHAVVPGFILFLFILCVFSTSVSFFLLYSSPILVYIGLYLRNNSNTRRSKSDISFQEKNNGNEASLSALQSEYVSSNNSSKDLRPQRSVRQNARRQVEEVGKDWESQASEEEKDKVILTSIYNELLGRKTPPSLKEPSDEVTFPSGRESLFDEKVEVSSCGSKNFGADPFENLASDWGETAKVDGSEEDEDDEQNQESGNKAVEWNEDDEKNLMDLGFSEIERNKRLEILIARRRMRKLFLLAAEKSLMDMEIPSICVGRNYFDLDRQNTYDFDGLQMPGSAPSVLSPSRSPFDLPYEPQEERPNLTGDSFQQEFSVANQKDMFFCRHESFCCRHFPVGYIQDSKLGSHSKSKQEPIDGLRISRFSTQFNKEEDDYHPVQKQEPLCEKHHLAKGTNLETEKSNDAKEETERVYSCPKSEVRIETDCIGKTDSVSDHSSPKESEKDFNVGNQIEVSEISDQTDGKRKYQLGIRIHTRNSLVSRSFSSSSLGTERQRYMEFFGYQTSKGRHRATMSMDSDLNVEVSDIGSPPTTDAGTDSSDDYPPVQKQEPLCEKHHLAKVTNPETEKGNDTEEENETVYSCPKSEVRIETDYIGKDDSDSDHSSPKESEKDFNDGNQIEVSEISDQADGKQKYPLGIRNHIRNSLISRSFSSSSLGTERQRYMEFFGYHTSKGRHRATVSMDSDLNVEVSDIGSPPSTDGGNDSSNDENTSFVYESDVGKEMDFPDEETEPKPKNANYEFISSNSEKREDMTAVPLIMQPLEVNSEIVEESEELSQKPADEIKISYGLDDQEQAPEIDPESPIHDHDTYKEQN